MSAKIIQQRITEILARWCPHHCAKFNKEPYEPNVYAGHVAKAIVDEMDTVPELHQCHQCLEWIADGEEPDGCRDPNCPEL